MAANFNVQFIINEKTNSKLIKLTDTSTGFTLAKGNFSITFPDGSTRIKTDFNSPDISTAGGNISVLLVTDINNDVLTGSYKIDFVALDASNNSYTTTKPFDFNWIKPANGLTDLSDSIIPEVKFSDATSYGVNGSFTGTATRTIATVTPLTAAIAGVPISTTSSILDVKLSGNYYEGKYIVTNDLSISYTHTSSSWLTVSYIALNSKQFDVRQTPSQAVLIQKINTYKDYIDSLKDINADKYNILSEEYDNVVALYIHLITRYEAGLLDGSQSILSDLLGLIEPYVPHTYQSAPMTAFSLATNISQSFTVTDGTTTKNVALGSTLSFLSNLGALGFTVDTSGIHIAAKGTSSQYIKGDGSLATFAESDPIFTASAASSITNSDKTNWNSAYSWGNHASAGYLSASTAASTYQPIDADLTSIAAVTGSSGFLRKNISNVWYLDTSTYLTSYTEVDPVFVASPAYTITNTNKTQWSTAYSWGNHASAGYLTSEADTLATVTGRGATTATAISVTNTTDSSSVITGAFIVSGGIGVAKNAYIGGNLVVSGNLTINGTTTTVSTSNLSVTDSLIYLSDSQFTTDILDIGIYGAYSPTGTGHVHTGIVRDASDGIWKLISNAGEPTSNVVDFTGVTYDTLLAGAFKKNGGTSSQFLKADGSVDSNSYYLASNPNGYTANTGTVTSVSGTGTAFGLTLTGTVTSTGNLTLGGTLAVPIANITATGTPSATTYLRGDGTWATPVGGGGTVTSVAALTLGTTGTDLSSTVANSTTTPVITLNVPNASATNRGALTSADWTTFNNKQAGSTNLTSLSGLTYVSASFVKMTAAGTFALDTNTYYLASNPSGYTNNTGTVTSVGGTGTAFGLTLTGTVTTSGNLTLGGTLAVPVANITATGTPSATTYLRGDGTWATPTGGGSGTVTSVAALTLGTTGTDLSSTVANSTTTPVITLNVPNASATNRGALTSTDWTTFNNKQAQITLTTTGTSGAATFIGNTLNIPQYQGGVTSFNTRTGSITLSSSDITAALGYTPVTTARTITINGVGYDLTADRSWTISGGAVGTISRNVQSFLATSSQTTFTISGGYTAGYIDVYVNGVRLTTSDYTASNGTTVVLSAGLIANDIVDIAVYNGIALSGTAPIVYNPSTGVISITQATTSTGGYLSSTDWNTFNNKQATISLTVTGSSGAATFSANTLNIPTYTLAGLGGQTSSTNLTSLSGLTYTSTSFVKMTAAGTFALDTNTYLTNYTETDPIYTASSWYTTTNNSSNWNTAYGWGNHASIGYLTTESDTLATVTTRGATTGVALSLTNVTDASSTSTGALIISGGIGVAKNAYIGGNLVVSGNLTITGTTTTVSTSNLSVSDSLIYLSDSQFTTDVLDIGIYGAYSPTGTGHVHTGLVRDASDAIWKLISNSPEPTANVVDFTSVTYDTLLAGAFKKNGGTSSQFLKADGTVDSSAYLTSTGTNATNTIPKFSGTKILGDSSISDNGTLVSINSATVIGATSIVSTAQLQVDSTTKGFLPPRMTSAQRTAITTPANGLIVYQTDGVEGMYISTSTGWRSLTMV